MNSKNMGVLVNIIGAVESGGQIYGNRRYDAYAGQFENTSKEYTVTLGWAQNYGSEAKKLIQLIYDANPSEFEQIDSNGSIKSMLSKDWVAIRWNPTSSQKNTLIRLITTDTGKKCQDELFAELMKKFISDCESNYTKDIRAIMMYCEIRHLGGKNPAERIFNRCKGDYSLDAIMASLKKDQNDKSSNNQVGDSLFWSRHQKCKEFIEKYVDSSDVSQDKAVDSMGITAEKIIERAKHYIGYREKNHASADMESFTADAGSGNYQKFQPLAGAGNGDQWCQYFVDGVAVEVTGSIANAKEFLCQTNSGNYMTGYTPDGSSYFKNAGRWYTTPEKGDVIYFYSSSMGRICHVGYVESVDKSSKIVHTIEGNTNSDGFTTNGGCVARHSYSYAQVGNGNRVAGFGRPRYDYVEEIYLKKGMNGNDVKTLQENLLLVGFADCGYYSNPSKFCDGSFGDITEKSVLALQKSCGLEEDGIYGNESDKALNELLKDAKNSKLSLNVSGFLKIAKETTDYVKGWNYGNAAFLPSVYKYEHLASCDRLVDMILWNAGLKDVGNRNVGALEKYLSNYQGVKKITKLTEVKAGDIVFLTGHVFLVGNKKENGMYERYDGGSDARLKSNQPFVEPINGFVCAYRLPFVTDIEINKDKKLNLVKCGQVHLNNYIHANLEVDGEYGKNTRKAFIKAIQTALNRSHGCGLIVDGIFGAKTESSLKKYVVMLNTKSDLATVLGIGLYINGIEPYGLVANDKMIKALKTYQKQYNLEVDGVAGVLTFKSLATIK